MLASVAMLLAGVVGSGARAQQDRAAWNARYLDTSQSVLECWREIASRLPPDINLTRLTYRGTGTVELAGLATRPDPIFTFKQGMDSCPLFTNVTVFGPRSDNNSDRPTFAISLRLKGHPPRERVPDELLPHFPADMDVTVRWLMSIDQVASMNGLQITRRNASQELAVGDANELLIDIEWNGTEESLFRFLYDIQGQGVMLDVRDCMMQSGANNLLSGRITFGFLYRKEKHGQTPPAATGSAPAQSPRVSLPAPPHAARYQVILDRKAFFQSLTSAPPPPPPPPPEPFTKTLRLVGLIRDGSNVRVGIIDIGRNPIQTYYMAVGDEENGIMVVEADFETERVRVRKGNEEYWLTLDNAPRLATGAIPSNLARPSSISADAYAERVRRRRDIEEARRRQLAGNPMLTSTQLEQRLQAYQMELIRAGGAKGSPLPMQLTPEMDAQLVKEGILPPLADQARESETNHPESPKP